MYFARLSVNEIMNLQEKKCSGLEWSIYAVISSHIHSVKKNTAYPSLKRIQSLLGKNPPKIQNIVRAITRMVEKGILKKGAAKTKSRFTLIHRPIQATKKIVSQAKKFIHRYSPQSIANLIPKTNRLSRMGEETNHIGEPKRNTLREDLNLYEKRGEDIWFKIAPAGFNEKVNIDRLGPGEREIFFGWLGNEKQNETKKWIQEQLRRTV